MTGILNELSQLFKESEACNPAFATVPAPIPPTPLFTSPATHSVVPRSERYRQTSSNCCLPPDGGISIIGAACVYIFINEAHDSASSISQVNTLRIDTATHT